jgi:hypothetical protein
MMRYNLGTTQIQDQNGNWQYLKGAWIYQSDGTWAPIKTGWVCKDDGTWERIYPTPRGIMTANVSQISHDFYQYHYDTQNVVQMTNTGDDDLIISALEFNDSKTSGINNYTTLNYHFSQLPITLAPGASTKMVLSVYGNAVGSFSGNIQIDSYSSYFPNYVANVIPVTANIKPDFNGISLIGTSPVTLSTYVGDDATLFTEYLPVTRTLTINPDIYTVDIKLTGGGGGGGGHDSHGGANGYSGSTIRGSLSVTPGDTLTIYVGGGGAAGANQTEGGYASGGYSDSTFGGGQGGPAGYSGTSGAGGGGGAATALYHNGVLVAVAAGGGGGGGGGNHSYGRGQESFVSSGSNAGGNGAGRGGSDGGGPGGGGGGYPGGAAGDVVGGDEGSYSGRSGINLLPSGWTATLANNGGNANSSAGGDGSFVVTEYSVARDNSTTFYIQNSGNGDELHISNITSANGFVTVTSSTTANVFYDFTNYIGDTFPITIAPFTTGGSSGTKYDEIIITSNAINAPTFTIPVQINNILASGHEAFTQPGVYQFIVPPHVHTLNAFMVGAGGGGGGGYSTNGGGGGGGGSGGYQYTNGLPVTPGETITVTVGGSGYGGVGESSQSVVPVSSPNWSSFMQEFGVFTMPPGSLVPLNFWQSFLRTWNAPVAGTYTLNLSGTPRVGALINGTPVCSSNSAITTSSSTFTAGAGNNSILIGIFNDGSVPQCGVAATITDVHDAIIWSTLYNMDPAAGGNGENTTISGSFGSITVTGGGSGGSASYTSPNVNHDAENFGIVTAILIAFGF